VLTPVVQRWRDRRGTYRPAGEVFDPRAHEVAEIKEDTTPRAFVCQHHYSASYPPARWRFGLYERAELVGVAVFSVSLRDEVLHPLPPKHAVELGRFVLLDRVRANAETWLLARCLEALQRKGLAGVVSFSDPHPRHDAQGRLVMPGHVGTVYQASNALYIGQRKSEWIHVLRDGTVLHNRALAKVRAQDSGWRPIVARLVADGAPLLEGDPAAWLARVLPLVTRPMKHPGNHKYVLPIGSASKRALRNVRTLPYPKFAVPQLSLPEPPLFARVAPEPTEK
jgi:hypothetical protein